MEMDDRSDGFRVLLLKSPTNGGSGTLAGGAGVAGIKQFLAGKLTPEDMAQLEKMIAALGGGEGDRPEAPGGDDDMDAAPAQDEERGRR